MAVSKRLRFEILRRDNHTCRYCGVTAPDAKLTVDHVIPEALGGSDDPSNLVAACGDCNGGKSSMPADAALVADVAGDAMRWAAAMRQAAEEIAAEDDAIERILDAFYDAWQPYWIPADWSSSVVTFIRAGLSQDTLLYLADTARRKRGLGDRWAYFCGCCWKRIRQMQDRAAELVGSPLQDSPRARLLGTIWTGDELKQHFDANYQNALSWYDEKQLASILNCKHRESGAYCGDPVCRMEIATALYYCALEREGAAFNRTDRDNAVLDEAEALLDG
ncbi:HNH endonuclease domain protein [Mycobacterium parascrofulaceum ATCC BAA-614]|uniref:HNH endonuclease domain protein n=1 Tax=Mycobacterium parascrofulaceum ATCC BAA-614 TaxID=525368 RepID=D5PF85_9MYCO|nr:HNH endonuclease [Mycobacterium parascrofulaceum]EFG75266.1 HNH endonuclease domain protein [Mycobacterium parascrofulaceum ATCC BAA-614]